MPVNWIEDGPEKYGSQVCLQLEGRRDTNQKPPQDTLEGVVSAASIYQRYPLGRQKVKQFSLILDRFDSITFRQ